MKWIALAAALIAVYPLGLWLRGRLARQWQLWTLVGFFPFISVPDIALVAYAAFPGDTHGIEVSLIDVVLLALFFAQRGPRRPLPYRFALAAYFLVAVVAAFQAPWKMAAFGYVWKLCRMYFLLAVVCRAGEDERVPSALLRGMMAGLVYEAGWAVWQRFGLGMLQVTGSFFHQNTLGTMVNLVVMMPIVLIIEGRSSRLAALAVASAVLTNLLTVSRGALFFLGLGSCLVYFLSLLRGRTVRKATIGFVGLLLAPALLFVAMNTLSSRSSEEKEQSLLLRRQYEDAASLMLKEHPFGVGPNHFTVMLVANGYGDRTGIDWSQRVAIVHNIYWLTAAEMGYMGVVALLMLLFTPMIIALRYSFLGRGDPRGDMLLGLGVGLAIVNVHGLFEWVWRQNEVSYAYWMVVAVVACLARQIRKGSQETAPLNGIATPELPATGAV